MSSAVAGYKQPLGADAPPACYEDIDHADLIFIVGSNAAYAHPVLYRRIEEARKKNPALKLLVADPRRTDTARDADLFLQILPGTDVALFNGMLHICLWEDMVDTGYVDAHTEGFAELKRIVRDYTPTYVADICGISEEVLAKAARLWGVDEVPAKPGKTAVEMFEAVRAGEIRILWIACTNPAQSMPEQKLIRAALEKAELVIVQEAYRTTATVEYADVLLPATSWGEKEGTVTFFVCCISRVRAALPKPGEARHDWEIVIDFARRLEKLLGKSGTLFPFQHAEQIWNEHRDTTRGRDLDITGLSYRLLEEQGPQQWPFPKDAASGKKRLYEDGVLPTASKRTKKAPTRYQPVAEPVDARYPFRLTTGRLRDQWHGMSRTGTVAQLFSHAAEPAVVLAQADMNRRLLKNGDLVHVTSRRGSQILPVQAGDDMRPGQAFIGMHWGEEYVSGRQGEGAVCSATYGVNALTL